MRDCGHGLETVDGCDGCEVLLAWLAVQLAEVRLLAARITRLENAIKKEAGA